MGFNLTNEYIDQTFQQLTQISGSVLVDGTGSAINNLTVTSSFATTASYALNGHVSASYAQFATSASHADNANTASFALNFNPSATASYALFATSASRAISALTSDSTTEIFVNAKNVQGVAIPKGYAVHSSGVTGENVNITTASYLDSSIMPAIGITQTQINAGAVGEVIITGRLKNVNTSNLVAGDPVYVNGEGALTATKPTGSALIQNIGVCAKVNATEGEIIVMGAGRSNDLPNLTTDYIWKGDANGVPQAVASSSIIPTTANTASYVAAANIDGTVASATSASHAINADTASFLPSSTRLNITDITASNASFTSASIGYLKTITGSATIIGDEYIILNADSPTKRFAGIKVYDSGSGLTGSFEWDSVDDNWIQVETGGDSAGMLTGPSGSKGSEVYPTANTLIKGTGNHTVVDTNITDDGSTVKINSNTQITGSVNTTLGVTAPSFTGSLLGTASHAANAGDWDGSYTGTASITGSLIVSGGNFDVLGATRNGSSIDSNFKQTIASPGSNNQYDLVAAGSGTIGSKNYTNRNFFFADYSGFGDQFKDYFSIEYYDSFSYNYGSEFNVNGIVGRFATTASGSGAGTSRFSVIETRDNQDGTGQIRLSSGDQNKMLFQAGNEGIQVSGSVKSEINALSIASNTASLDCQDGDMFTLTLVSGSNTHLNASNVQAGQTISLKVLQPSTATDSYGTMTFESEFAFAGGTAPTITAASGSTDILTFQSYDATTLFGTAVQNLS